MPEVRSPTVRRRELGGILRTLRLARGMTVDQVAERLLCSPSKVSRMETGSRGATLRDVRDLCDLYEVKDPAERDRLAKLATEGKQQGWWQPYELDFATYVGLEAEATTLADFRCTIVPGLLQTAAYARAMHAAGVPEISPERIDAFIKVRATRQRLLTDRDPPLRLTAVIDEAMLHRMVGGHEVMAEQVDRLIVATQLPNVTIRVVSQESGAHPAMDSNFNILEFAGPASSVVYVEGLVGWIYLERAQDLARYREVFESLQAISLSPQESIELMAEIGAQHKKRATI